MSRQGHAVGYAANGREALAASRDAPWDLELLDITMPELDGYQTQQAIKAVAAQAGAGADALVEALARQLACHTGQ